jgi:predicted ATP-dependent endonuclease of OLD family
MYLSSIQINGFRGFKELTVSFNDGVNVIIGHNNAGKSNLLKAIALAIDGKTAKRLEVDDFYKNCQLEDLKTKAPEVTIALTFTQSKNEDLTSDDLVTVSTWLTKLDHPYEARLTYRFFLPTSLEDKYHATMASVTDVHDAWLRIKHDFLRLYVAKLYCGNANLLVTADPETIQKFDFQFVNAIRDVERDMFSGRNTLLRAVLDFFLDYDEKSKKGTSVTPEAIRAAIKARGDEFSAKSRELLDLLQARMKEGKGQILAYAKETGASFDNAEPDFEGTLSEVELFTALRLIVQYETGIKIPATHNGLGYNNLIYMSLLLAKMQVDSDGSYLERNAKVFPILAIEEPEAHLHPAMQYLFLKFLRKNIQESKKVRQLFVTTHSTQITSAVTLDEIICLHGLGGKIAVGYPGKVFADDPAGKKSKAYVQRFLDATKSDMLLARSVILVEGIAEQLLVPVLLRYENLPLEEHHAVVINVGGRYFEHFLHLFDGNNPNAIPKRISCITDVDPERKLLPKGKFRKCYPFEMGIESEKYEYRVYSASKVDKYKLHSNIRFFSQNAVTGKTLEYELMWCNALSEICLTESMSNIAELEELISWIKVGTKPLGEFVAKLRKSDENEAIVKGVELSDWEEIDKKKGIVAARYLNSVSKGEHALELSQKLIENLEAVKKEELSVPTYIKEAGKWVCQ